METTHVVCIGAGPAGLTASYLLSRKNIPVVVLEKDPDYVGGISRTVEYKGFSFDIGGHRFFSKSKEVEALWDELMPDDMLVRPRSSRIYYKGKFYSYPLKAMEAFFNLGPIEAARCVLSYAWARIAPFPEARNFEEWVSDRFGKRLFNIFFKTYTEKVWGMSCREISADWAAQRIKNLSLSKAILNALLPQKKSSDRKQVVTSLIDTFRYPRRGPGMMWDAAARKTREQGGDVRMGATVTGLHYDLASALWYVDYACADGEEKTIAARHVISSAPLREVVQNLSPAPSEEALKAAEGLRYRDFLTVAVVLKDRNLFPDNWIYIHDPSVTVGRIQNFKSWSPELVPDESMACYGLEYFCFEGDELWSAPDEDLIERAKDELAKLGLAKREDVLDGCVVRQPKAYPVYDADYADFVDAIRAELGERFPNLHLVGRNGMHKYNNQDHAMMTAMLTAENIVANGIVYDVWAVNQDAEYHEAGESGAEQQVENLRYMPDQVRTEAA